MSDRDDLLWALQRQARTLQEVVSDARLVWRDANARSAEERFLQPRAEAEAAILLAVAAQHRALDAAEADLRHAEEQHGIASAQSAQAGRSCEQSGQSARAAQSEAEVANAQAAQADQTAALARSTIAQAAAAGDG